MKTYNKEEIATELSKSMYKAVKKALNRKKKDTQLIVEDVLDPNYMAEVDPDEVPDSKNSVIIKNNTHKLLKSDKNLSKGIDKLKVFLENKNNLK